MRYLSLALLLTACAPPEDDLNRDDEPDLAFVQGDDERVMVSAEESTAYPWNAVAALRPRSARKTASCTAFAVGPRHLLTAAHCIEGLDKSGAFQISTTKQILRLVFGQYGSGNAPVNMSVHGKTIALEDIFVAPEWAASKWSDRRHDWALLRLKDEDSLPEWFDARWRSDRFVQDAAALIVDGYPLDTVTHDERGTDFSCAASPLASKDCGGYQYRAFAKLAGMSPTFLELAVDWDRGQSGGPIFTEIEGQRQRIAVALVTSNLNGRNFARRIEPAMSQKICEEVLRFRSTKYRTHECAE